MRRLVGLVVGAFAVALSIGTANAAPTPPPQAKGVFKTAMGETIGVVLLTQLRDGRVYVSSEVKGLPAATHGFTMRENGACAPNFDAAGAATRSEGLPNLTVMPSGMDTLEAYTTNVTVAPTDKSVFDANGTAVLITAFGDEAQKAACAVLEPVPVPAPAGPSTGATAEFKSATGESLGTATMTSNLDGSVRLQVQARGLPAGEHAIHVHQFGQCAPVFGAVGEHHNPLNKTHGQRSGDPDHSGDLSNLVVGADGTAAYEATTAEFTLSPSDLTILDSDGSALIIHARPDDYVTDPGGMADGRIACAVVQAANISQPAPAAPAPAAPAQPGAQVPAQLPSTGGADMTWMGALAALALIGGGLALRRK